MATLTAERGALPWYRRLYLPAYRVGDAARYAGSYRQTVAFWHYGRNPVLPERVRRRPLSYLELVEVAFVAYFRRVGVTLQRIRTAREYIGQNFNAEYPFAEYRFKTEGYHILMDYYQIDSDPGFQKLIVADAAGQLAWADLMGDKFAEFDYELELAVTWHPAGRQSLVRIDPRISFGAPIVNGIPTWTIKGRWNAGESLEDIQDDFGLSEEAIKDALSFEKVEFSNNGNGRHSQPDVVL